MLALYLHACYQNGDIAKKSRQNNAISSDNGNHFLGNLNHQIDITSSETMDRNKRITKNQNLLKQRKLCQDYIYEYQDTNKAISELLDHTTERELAYISERQKLAQSHGMVWRDIQQVEQSLIEMKKNSCDRYRELLQYKFKLERRFILLQYDILDIDEKYSPLNV
eukprot:Awhi_evm1s503